MCSSLRNYFFEDFPLRRVNLARGVEDRSYNFVTLFTLVAVGEGGIFIVKTAREPILKTVTESIREGKR